MNVRGTQNSVFGMNTNAPNSKNSGKLLLISDLEGCQPNGPPPAKVQLARFMCDQAFFDEVGKFLAANTANKVAFLGDYFDQGDKVVDSINGIMGLYNKYKDRIHIIVGNRDVNKFRLAYEMKAEPEEVGTLDKWVIWSGFFSGIQTKTNLKERLNWILAKSMGADVPNGNVFLKSGLNQLQASYLLLKIFSEKRAKEFRDVNPKNGNSSPVKYDSIDSEYSTFITNVRELFKVAKIVHYDPDFKTLMSHAGGMDTFLFHTPAYYEKIKEAINGQNAYYDKMEIARKMLMNNPKDTGDNTTEWIEETYNAPLKAVVSEVFKDKPSETSSETPSADFFLLQALGLKPDEGKHFVSFIQSCDNTSCKGPNGSDSGIVYEGYPQFQKLLVEKDVKVLASGHAPHCTPVPLIYTRSDYPTSNANNSRKIPLLYVLNDTSNGYRPADRVTDISKYPLAYVTLGGEAAGVGMLPSLAATGMEGDAFGPMFDEWTATTAPKFMLDSNVVQYTNGTLSFPGRPFIPPKSFAPAVLTKTTAGGRRRLRKTRKSKKAQRKAKKTRKH